MMHLLQTSFISRRRHFSYPVPKFFGTSQWSPGAYPYPFSATAVFILCNSAKAWGELRFLQNTHTQSGKEAGQSLEKAEGQHGLNVASSGAPLNQGRLSFTAFKSLIPWPDFSLNTWGTLSPRGAGEGWRLRSEKGKGRGNFERRTV